ncbi:MAG: hypothetical protein R3C05_14550 [Pirellulaceae bacterium]
MSFAQFLLIVAGLASVTLDQVDGSRIQGEWVAVDEDSISIQSRSGQVEKIPLDAILKLQRDEAFAEPRTAPQVGLNDGTELRTTRISLEGSSLELQLADGNGKGTSLKVPLSEVGWIRFRPGISTTINNQWDAKREADKPADTLVVRADGERLDEVAGTVLGINDEAVKFDLDGQSIDAPRPRLEGIIFRATASDAPKLKAQVIDRTGSIWAASKLSGSGEQLTLTTFGGLTRTLPLEQVQRIEFRGNVRMVRASDVAEASLTPVIGNLVDAEFAKTLFGPRDVADGVVMSSGSELTIRLNDEDRLFETVVEAKNRQFSGGKMQLIVLLDEAKAIDKTLSRDELPHSIRLELGKHRRLSIRLESAGDSSTGDTVLLRKPRIRR